MAERAVNYILGRYTIVDRIAFFIDEEYIFDQYHNVFLQLNTDYFDVILADKFSEDKYADLMDRLKSYSWNIKFLKDVLYNYKYKVFVTRLYLGGSTIGLLINKAAMNSRM